MLFKNIVGQVEVKQKLITMVEHNRLSHALLFLGKEGSGALPLALAFANYISLNPTGSQIKPAESSVDLFGETVLTEHKIPTNADEADAFIQHHQSYGKVKDLVHPDIHYTYPVITKKAGEKPLSSDFITNWRQFVKEQPYGNVFDWLQYIGAENKQGNISAHECNEIIRKLSLKSFESEYKILVLWMPEFLGKEGNKLLKLIEEPPPNTLFILVAESEDQILATILSRTQLVKVPLPHDEEIIQYLREKTDVVKAMQIVGISEGNVREALHLLVGDEDDWLLLVRDCFNAVKKTGPIGMVQWVTSLNELGRERQKQFIRYFIHILENCIKASILGINYIHLPDNEKEFVQRLNKITPVDALEEMANLLNDQIYYIERNANAKMLFHALIIRIYHIIANKNVILIS
jgi:DNA polymerase III subunit delta'